MFFDSVPKHKAANIENRAFVEFQLCYVLLSFSLSPRDICINIHVDVDLDVGMIPSPVLEQPSKGDRWW